MTYTTCEHLPVTGGGILEKSRSRSLSGLAGPGAAWVEVTPSRGLELSGDRAADLRDALEGGRRLAPTLARSCNMQVLNDHISCVPETYSSQYL